MKGMRENFLKKLKSIPTIGTLRNGLLFQLNPADTFSNQSHQTLALLVLKDEDQTNNNLSGEPVVKELNEDEKLVDVGYKEKVTPPSMVLSNIDMKRQIAREAKDGDDEKYTSLLDFEEKCPPGGGSCVILYSTSLTGIRKTFEDCKAVRFLLQGFKVSVQVRDVLMHMEFREELWRIFGGRVIPPRLFIKGRYIGGADEVRGLHEQGKLKKLLEGVPLDLSNSPCAGCADLRFVVCFNCNGSRKVFTDGDQDENAECYIRCLDCNENGLINCSICS